MALLALLAAAPAALADGSGGASAGSSGSTSANGSGTSGGAATGSQPASRGSSRTGSPAPAGAPAGSRGTWIGGFTLTEYWPVPESWFSGKLVSAPGLSGKHRIDWLYSARGVSMQGEGMGLDGRMYHIDSLGDGGWVTAQGKTTNAARGWDGGTPYWRAGAYWKNARGQVTFPLGGGAWSNGAGVRYVPLPGVSFAPGASLPLKPYQSIAVDPRVIPLGSLVYLPAYRDDGHGGWFVAQDTGGAIKRRHIDVYRTPPNAASDGGQLLTGERAYVIRAS